MDELNGSHPARVDFGDGRQRNGCTSPRNEERTAGLGILLFLSRRSRDHVGFRRHWLDPVTARSVYISVRDSHLSCRTRLVRRMCQRVQSSVGPGNVTAAGTDNSSGHWKRALSTYSTAFYGKCGPMHTRWDIRVECCLLGCAL